jgi:hypothetical protein
MEEWLSMGPDSGLSAVNGAGEWQEVSQEDMVRVSESSKKAAMIGGQIREDNKKNAHLAQFLEFLFSAVQSDAVWTKVIPLCTRADITGKVQTLSLHELIAFFVPFFPAEAEQFQIHDAIPDLPACANTQLDGYSLYIAEIRRLFEYAKTMDRREMAEFVLELLAYFGVFSLEGIADEQRAELIEQIMVMVV